MSLTAIAQIATALTGALVSVLLARVLGASGLGAFNVLISLVLVWLAIGTLGLDFGVSYAVARREWNAGDALRQIQIASVVLGVASLGVSIALFFGFRDSAFRHLSVSDVLLALACLPFALSSQITAALALSLDRYELSAATPAVQSTLALILAACLAPIFGLPGALAAFTAAYVLTASALLAAGFLRFGVPNSDWLSTSWRRIRRAVKFGFGVSLTSALWLLVQRVDLFVLSAFADAPAVGRYSLAVSLTSAQLLLPRALAQVVLPRIAALGKASGADQQQVVEKSLRHTVLLVGATSLAMAAALPLTPLIFGSDFEQSFPLGEILVPGVAAAGLVSVMSSVLVGNGQARAVTRIGVASILLSGALYAALIPAFAAWGAAIASTGAYAAIALLYLVALRRSGRAGRAREWLPGRAELREYAPVLKALLRFMPRAGWRR